LEVIRDLVYAPAEPAGSRGNLLDLYLPARGHGRLPLVIWGHGSGWLAENGRQGADALADILGPRGFAVAGVAIRSSAHARFPGQLRDIQAAIAWLRRHARLDSRRFAIMGESSGGWAAAMAGVTGGVQAVVAFYPPTDFLQMDAFMLEDGAPFNQRFGLTGGHADPRSPESLLLGCAIESCPERVARANPITYVGGNTPPFMILHGQQDLFVPYEQSLLLYRALARAGRDATLFTLPNAGHGFVNDPPGLEDAAVTEGSRPLAPSWDIIARWLRRRLDVR
jgi:acetyl esterase/lipase